MGHGDSKLSSSSVTEKKGSRRARFKLHISHYIRHRTTNGNGNGDANGKGSSSSSASSHKLISADNFAGIALFTLLRAEMQFKDKWIACLSLGEQTFRTKTSDNTDKPVWNSEKKLLLEQNGPHVARISVYETNKLSSNTLVGYCEIDLFEFLIQDSDSDIEIINLLDPSIPGKVVGSISISCSIEDPIETEKGFVRRILSIVDYNEDGMLSLSEFSDLIDAFGNQLATNKKEELFKAADKNGDGVVSMDELAALLTFQQEKEPLLNCCPVCGEVLNISDQLNSMIHLTLCFDEGTGNQVMTGGFLTDKQASYGWFFKLSEWAHFSSYDVGIRSGSSASHILVYDRKSQRLVEEIIDKKIVLS
ncbi:phosphatidylserine decarboxylase, partial [Stylosanthes scabra]|nr:phosphatidylserine decarboxylase [Stylosanthes scabra]